MAFNKISLKNIKKNCLTFFLVGSITQSGESIFSCLEEVEIFISLLF